MTSISTSLPGVIIFEPRILADSRGFFFESFRQNFFDNTVRTPGSTNGRPFVQDNHSRSVRNVLRGLHYQIGKPQGKLVRVVTGEIFDVAVDIRRSSPMFGRWVGTILSAENNRQLWIPEGFAHGFLVLSEVAEVLYKASDYYSPDSERILLWSDPRVGVEWPITGPPILASKDALGLRLENAETFA